MNYEIGTHKKCIKCERYKSISEFHKSPLYLDRRDPRCKDCWIGWKPSCLSLAAAV